MHVKLFHKQSYCMASEILKAGKILCANHFYGDLCQFQGLTAPGHCLISLYEEKQCEYPSKCLFLCSFKKKKSIQKQHEGEQNNFWIMRASSTSQEDTDQSMISL